MSKDQGKGQQDMSWWECYRPSSHGEEAHGIVYKQLGRVPLIGDFNLPVSSGNIIQQRENSLGDPWREWKRTS